MEDWTAPGTIVRLRGGDDSGGDITIFFFCWWLVLLMSGGNVSGFIHGRWSLICRLMLIVVIVVVVGCDYRYDDYESPFSVPGTGTTLLTLDGRGTNKNRLDLS